MGEKHPDRTSEWQKQNQALKNPKIPLPSALPHKDTGSNYEKKEKQ
jgi:hypothetical protein